MRRAIDPAMVKLGRIAVAHALRFPEIPRQAHTTGWSPRHETLIDLLKRHAAKGSIVAEDPEIWLNTFGHGVSHAGPPCFIRHCSECRRAKAPH